MKRTSFANTKNKSKPELFSSHDKEFMPCLAKLTGFEIVGIKKPMTVSDSDMVGQPVFYERRLVGTIMDQWDGHTLIDVSEGSTFIIDGYKSGQIKGKDLKIHLRG